MNDRICGLYLKRAGLIKYHPHSSTPISPTALHIQSSRTFDGLSHWIYTRLFSPVETLIITLSCDEPNRNIQFRSLEKFFGSLVYGVRQFGSIYIHLSDFARPVNLNLLGRTLQAIGRTGCASLTMQSSGHYETSLTVDDVIDPLRSLKGLAIDTSSIFTQPLSSWLLRSIQCSRTDLQELCLSRTGLSQYQWSQFLAAITLPQLRRLFVEGVSLLSLARFLIRHPSLEELDLNGVVLDNAPQTAIVAEVMLPSLRRIIGDGLILYNFSQLLKPSPTMLSEIQFQGDLSYGPENSEYLFDTTAHLGALQRFIDIHVNAFERLTFTFPSLPEFTEPLFMNCDRRAQLYRCLSVDVVEIIMICETDDECRSLLVSDIAHF